jgi:hypothetical protein
MGPTVDEILYYRRRAAEEWSAARAARHPAAAAAHEALARRYAALINVLAPLIAEDLPWPLPKPGHSSRWQQERP